MSGSLSTAMDGLVPDLTSTSVCCVWLIEL